MARNTLGVVRDVSAQPAGRHRLGLGAKTSTEAWELRPRRLGEEMNRHQQLGLVGEGNKHVAVGMSTIFDAGAVHEALMALEELVFVSIPVAHESSDAVEFGFVATDLRARPEEIVKRQLGDCATVLWAEVEP